MTSISVAWLVMISSNITCTSFWQPYIIDMLCVMLKITSAKKTPHSIYILHM